MVELISELNELYSEGKFLTPKQKELMLQFVKEMKNKLNRIYISL